MNKGNPNVNGRENTKDDNEDDILIHASWDEIEDNAKEKRSNVSEVGDHDHDPLSSYSSELDLMMMKTAVMMISEVRVDTRIS